MPDNVTREPWHLDKRVPLALIITILLQTGGAVWFAATLDSRVGVLERDVERERILNTQQGQTIQTIQQNAARQDQKLENILSIVERTDRRLEAMERSQRQQ